MYSSLCGSFVGFGWVVVLSCFCVVARWLPACFAVGAICPIVLVLSAFAWVGFSALVRFRSRSFSRLPSFLLAVLPVCGSVLVPFPVPLPSVWVFWWWRCSSCGFQTSTLWALPCGGGGVRGGVVVCSFPFSSFPSLGWRVGVVGLAILLSNLKVSSGKLHRLAGRV